MAYITTTAKSYLRKTNFYRFRNQPAKDVIKLLRGIEGDVGKTSPTLIKQSDEYAIEVLGHKKYAPWLYIYSAISNTFKEGWIPDNYYGLNVVPTINGSYGRMSIMKPLNNIFFGDPSFPDLGSYVNGIFLSKNYDVVDPVDIQDLLFESTDKIVHKTDNSCQGRGINFFTKDTFTIEKISELGNGVFQSFIRQHETLSKFSTSSVATLRITSYIEENGDISIRACYLRLGSGIDTHVQRTSSIRVPIDLGSGSFSQQGFLPNWLTTNIHPTSQIAFEGHIMPCFDKVVSTVKRLHRKVPFVRCIGWDVSIDDNENVSMIEWNAGHNDIKFGEAVQGPCFKGLGWENFHRQ